MPIQPGDIAASSGYPASGKTGNPVLDEISTAHANLSAPAQQAIEGAHGLLGISPNHSDSALAVPGVSAPRGPLPDLSAQVPARPLMKGSGPIGVPEVRPANVGGYENPDPTAGLAPSAPTPLADLLAPPMPVTPSVPPGNAPSPSALQQEHTRLTRPELPGNDPNAHTSLDTGRPGYDQIHNPWLRGLATVGNVVASGLFPRFGQFIPGTSAHHDLLVGENTRALGQEQAERKAEDESRLQNAQAVEQESLPELHKTQAELATEKLHSAETAKDADRAIKEADLDRKKGESDSKISETLRVHGYTIDPDTKEVRPLKYEEMSEDQKAVHDLKASQSELADARKAYVQAQKDNIPKAQEMALARIHTAQQNAGTAAQRLGLSRDQFEAEFFGTHNGQALPGAPADEAGNPIGTRVASVTKPTGTERTKADMAKSAAEQLSDIRGIIKKRPDIFGPLAGRKTDFDVWLGSQDPDAQAFRAAETVAADHMAGMFGSRSPAVVKELHDAIGRFKDNPEAALAGIGQVEKATKLFTDAGTVRTVNPAGSNVPTVTSKEQFDALPKGAVYMEDGHQFRKP